MMRSDWERYQWEREDLLQQLAHADKEEKQQIVLKIIKIDEWLEEQTVT